MTAKKTTATPATIDEVRAEMLPDASAAADDAEVADAMESAGITEAAAAFKKVAPAPPRATAAAKPRAPKSAPKTMFTSTSPEGDAAMAEALGTAPAKKAPAKADEPTISVWVGRKIAEMAKAQKRGSLGAKFRAVTPSKAGDHTVKLTRAEADKLSELAAKVEGESTGMMALSARTLQARIDFAWEA